jgi:DNA-binding CsgD family transcriptional regulator
LPACAEILLAAGDVEGAQRAADELEAVARDHELGVLRTIAAHTRGAVELAAGRPESALPSLRRAWHAWEELEAPYEAARVRELVGIACGEIGDRGSAARKLEAARHAFEALGAVHDVERIDARAGDGPSHGLTARELEVLRLVAEGRTNRQIANELVVSERTVERHVSNTFVKLRVQTRAAATAYAYEHRLL